MSRKKYTIECGEDEKLFPLVTSKKKLKSAYTRVFHEGILELVNDRDLSGSDLRVFLAIIGNLGYENKFTMSITSLGELLGMQRQNVGSCIKNLVKRRYLRKEKGIGNVNFYLVDPTIAVRCRNSKYGKVIDLWDRPKY